MTEPIIQAQNLSIRFGSNYAVEGATFSIAQGDFVAVIGPNGAGKSTLLRAMLGLIKPTDGLLRVLGDDPSLMRPMALGYVPQVKTLDRTFPGLGIELVVAGMRSSWPARIKPAERERAMKILEGVAAAHLADRPIGKLSGGELQRLYLARALAHEPRVILLDEPATGMDVPSESDMYHVLDEKQKAEAITVVMITHDWGAAMHHATRAMVMNRRVIGFGSPEEALSEENLREAFGHRGHAHAMRFTGHSHA